MTDDVLTDELLARLFAATASPSAIATAWDIPVDEVRRRARALGLERPKHRRSLSEVQGAAQYEAVRPLLVRLRGTQPRHARPVPRPAPELLARLPAEIRRLDGAARHLRRQHDRLHEIDADPEALERRARERYPDRMQLAADLQALAIAFSRWVGAMRRAKWIDAELTNRLRQALTIPVRRDGESVRRELRNIVRPDLLAHSRALTSAESDAAYARAALESLTTGPARSWRALDVATTCGYALRTPPELTDAEVLELRAAWLWGDIEPTDSELDAIEAEPGDADDLDPVLEDAIGALRDGRGAWEPMPARSDRRTPVRVLNAETRQREPDRFVRAWA